jgi:hypothetical protein
LQGDLHAGDRAPDAPQLIPVRGDAHTRLYEVFGCTYHTVMIFSSENELLNATLNALARYPSGLVKAVAIVPNATSYEALLDKSLEYIFVDARDYAYKHYNVTAPSPRIVAVRPDGAVGALVESVEDLEKYFSGIFSASP